MLCLCQKLEIFFVNRKCVGNSADNSFSGLARQDKAWPKIWYRLTCLLGVVMFYPCLFCPSDIMWRSQRTDARASVRALLYCYHTFLDHTKNINRKKCTEARQRVGNIKQCSKVSLGRNKLGQHNTTPLSLAINCRLAITRTDETAEYPISFNIIWQRN